jgi:hypothetical protein
MAQAAADLEAAEGGDDGDAQRPQPQLHVDVPSAAPEGEQGGGRGSRRADNSHRHSRSLSNQVQAVLPLKKKKPQSNPKGWARGKTTEEVLAARPNRIVNINADQVSPPLFWRALQCRDASAVHHRAAIVVALLLAHLCALLTQLEMLKVVSTAEAFALHKR